MAYSYNTALMQCHTRMTLIRDSTNDKSTWASNVKFYNYGGNHYSNKRYSIEIFLQVSIAQKILISHGQSYCNEGHINLSFNYRDNTCIWLQ